MKKNSARFWNICYTKIVLSDWLREAGSQIRNRSGQRGEVFCKSGILFLGSVRDGKVFQAQ